MRASTTLAATAIAASAALLLTACGGSNPPSDKIVGAQGPASASTSSSPSSTANRPTFTFPPDMKYVFEGGPTSDPVKDQILSDNEQRIKSLDYAVITNNIKSPGLIFYSSDDALVSGYHWIKQELDGGYSLTGTSRYYNRSVAWMNGNSAGVSYCLDQSQEFGKVRKTGQVLKTTTSPVDFVLFNVRMQKNAAGVWQTNLVDSFEGDKKCQP
jgi:hypothetical protein